jgi:hypothetical protein
MPPAVLYALLTALLVLLRATGASPPLTWSAAPPDAALLTAAGAWAPVDGLALRVRVPARARGAAAVGAANASAVFVHYALRASSTGAAGANAGLGFLSSRAQGLSSAKDYLGARVTLDGRPFRLGGALATPIAAPVLPAPGQGNAEAGASAPASAAATSQLVEVRGALSLTLAPGVHEIALQW